MNLIKKLSNLLAASQGSDANLYWLVVQCNRCGEVIRARINLANDLSIEYDEGGNKTGYSCRKVLIGKERCFQSIEVTLRFDAQHKLIDRKITDGKFVEG
jgi:hypothetical protein